MAKEAKKESKLELSEIEIVRLVTRIGISEANAAHNELLNSSRFKACIDEKGTKSSDKNKDVKDKIAFRVKNIKEGQISITNANNTEENRPITQDSMELLEKIVNDLLQKLYTSQESNPNGICTVKKVDENSDRYYVETTNQTGIISTGPEKTSVELEVRFGLSKTEVKQLKARINVNSPFFNSVSAHWQLVQHSHFDGTWPFFNGTEWENRKISFFFCHNFDYISEAEKKDKKDVRYEIEYSLIDNKDKKAKKADTAQQKSFKAILTKSDLEILGDAIDSYLKSIYDSKKVPNIMEASDLDDSAADPSKRKRSDDKKSRYELICFSDYKKLKRKLDSKEKNKLIYSVDYDPINNHYYIYTGPYCGIIYFNTGKETHSLEIETGYSNELFWRMLNSLCGIYTDTKTSKNSKKAAKSNYALIGQYLYLVSLRKVMGQMIPRQYVYPRERDYSIKGNIDVNAYVNHDLTVFDKKITYTYPQRVEIRNIMDVLYTALKRCKIADKDNILPNLVNFETFLRENSSGRPPSNHTVANILDERCLRNGLYSGYKEPLTLAQILLQNQNTSPGHSSDKAGISGYIIDSSFLWEMYLYNLMTKQGGLPDWKVEDQSTIYIYKDKNKDRSTHRFYGKENYPDFVVINRSNNNTFVLDAKFKQMTFVESDVDNKDVQQVHSYSYYFHLKEKERFKGTALIYPTKTDRPDGERYSASPMYGLDLPDDAPEFTILTFKDYPDDLLQSEKDFVRSLREFLSKSEIVD